MYSLQNRNMFRNHVYMNIDELAPLVFLMFRGKTSYIQQKNLHVERLDYLLVLNPFNFGSCHDRFLYTLK